MYDLSYRLYIEISLLKESTANYAGDGPKSKGSISMDLNGIKVAKKHLEHYISDIDLSVVKYTPENAPHLGDKIIQINEYYCEQINVCKYITNNVIRYMLLRASAGNEYAVRRVSKDMIDANTSSVIQNNGKKTRSYRVSSLELNGIQIIKNAMYYYISKIDRNSVQYLPLHSPRVGDRIIKIDNRYCDEIGNVYKYIETNIVNQWFLKTAFGEEYIVVRNNADISYKSKKEEQVEETTVTEINTLKVTSSDSQDKVDSMNSKLVPKRKLDDKESVISSKRRLSDQVHMHIKKHLQAPIESDDNINATDDTTAIEIFRSSICKHIKQPITCLSSLKLNGVQLIKKSLEYFIDKIDTNIFEQLFPKSNVNIGDKVVTINRDNLSILGNVLLYTDIVEIKDMVLINSMNEQYEITRVSTNNFSGSSLPSKHTNIGRTQKVKYNNSAHAIQQTIKLNEQNSNHPKGNDIVPSDNYINDSHYRNVSDDRYTNQRDNSILVQNDRQVDLHPVLQSLPNISERILCTSTRHTPRRSYQSLALSWNYDKPCTYCKYVHLNGATKGQQSKCCMNGAAFRAPFPQLSQLPPRILHYARDRILHMGRNSVSYNSVLSCAATGVENDTGGGFEIIHGNHAVKLHGRTYHYLTSTSGQGGIQYFTFDRMANCVQYATTTLNNVEKGYERIITPFLENIFRELQRYNIICQECEQIGYYAQDYVHNEGTRDFIASINERTSFLDVAQITSDAATGNRIITYLRKGTPRAKSIKPPDKMWEPFLYPLFFTHGERGWGSDIRKEIEYTDYLIARLLCPEKVTEDNTYEYLQVPNQQLDIFIAPIISHLPPDSNNNLDDLYRYYAKIFGNILQNSKKYAEAIKTVLKVLCTYLPNLINMNGYLQFFNELRHKLELESLDKIATFINYCMDHRRQIGLPEENIEKSLLHIAKFHCSHYLIKGKMMLLKVNRFQLMSRLSQIYLVDSVSRAIDYRLRFHRMHQQDLFGIQPSTADQQQEQGNTSTKTFLSQSMHGSTRHLRSLARNALALVSEYGRPSLFITLTCNPNWPEIIEQLLPGQTAFDRGDIVCQVFYRKLQALLANLRQGKYFPIKNSLKQWHKIQYEVRVIEYQRRGLPHAHIVLKFENHIHMPVYENKKELAKWIDYHITAEYPKTVNDLDPLENNEKYENDLEYSEIVKAHMLHKCISENNGGCLNEANVCAKGYDKNVTNNVTTFDHKGFPQYKRSTIKSLNVVPHNKLLLKDWNGHANVEFAGSTYTVIYLYKYLFKGNKKVKMRLNNIRKDDEISLYLRGRYLCSMDCYWRILGHETYPASSPAVNIIKVISDQNASLLIKENKVTDLIVYFNRPDNLQNFKYADIFNMYMWSYEKPKRNIYERNELYAIQIPGINKIVYLYKKKSTKKSITRLEIVSITAGELFYLRLILYNFNRASFEDCKCFARISYSTYQEAAIAAGIVKDKNEVFTCFEEALKFPFNTPAELRSLFVMTTIQGYPTLKILQEQKFKEMLYTDFYHDYEEDNPVAAWNDLLRDLCSRFESEGKNMQDYGLPLPKDMKTELEVEKLKYDPDMQRKLYLSLCNQTPNTHEQQQIFDEIACAIKHKQTRLFYIQGQAGSGKSTLAKKLMAWSRSNNKLCAGCASTGLAATIYEGFETAHSLFKFPVVEDDEREADVPIQCQLQHHKNRYEFLKATDFILWDEFPSCDREVFEAAYNALDGFENKVVVTMGDMRQIAPVVITGEKEDIINHSIPSSPLWKLFIKKYLTMNMRLCQATDTNSTSHSSSTHSQRQRKYAEMILSIGNGTHIPTTFKDGYINDKKRASMTVELQQCRAILCIDDAIDFVFPKPFNPDVFCKRAILCGTNDAVDEWNNRIQELNPNILQDPLASHDQLSESDDPHDILKQMLTEDVLNNFNNNGVPPHLLQLKVNDICIVLRNLNKKEGLTNNTRVRILNITSKCIRIQTLSSNKRSFSIPRIRFKFRLPFGRSFQLVRTQFPLRLAYCMTINKSQGQEFDACLLDIRLPPFAHGHLYVALSRIRDYEHIAIFTNENNIFDNIVTTENVVYPELLSL